MAESASVKGPSLSRRLVSAVAYAVAAAGCYYGFVLFGTGQQLDAFALGATVVEMPLELQLEVFGMLRPGFIAVFAVLAVLLGCVALFRAQWWLVVVTFVSCVVAVGAASLLRRVLWRPDLGVESYDYNTWPSGHVAAVCALTLACLRLIPHGRYRRSAFALVAVLVVTAGAYASMASFAHRPSDTLGAILICGAMFALTRPARPARPGLGGESGRGGWTGRGGGAGRGGVSWWPILVCIAAAAAAVLVLFPQMISPQEPRAALALGWLVAMFGAAWAVLLPESLAAGYDKRSRSSAAAAP